MAQTRCYQHLYVGAYLAALVYQSSVNCNAKQVDISDLKCIYCFLLGINCEQLLFKSHWKPATALGSEVLYTQYKAYALLLILPCGSTYVPSLPKICFVTYGCQIALYWLHHHWVLLWLVGFYRTAVSLLYFCFLFFFFSFLMSCSVPDIARAFPCCNEEWLLLMWKCCT